MLGQQSTNLDPTKRVSYTLPDLVGYEVSCSIACPQKLRWDKFIIQENSSHYSLLVSYNYWFYADLQACLLRFPGKTSKNCHFGTLAHYNREIGIASLYTAEFWKSERVGGRDYLYAYTFYL